MATHPHPPPRRHHHAQTPHGAATTTTAQREPRPPTQPPQYQHHHHHHQQQHLPSYSASAQGVPRAGGVTADETEPFRLGRGGRGAQLYGSNKPAQTPQQQRRTAAGFPPTYTPPAVTPIGSRATSPSQHPLQYNMGPMDAMLRAPGGTAPLQSATMRTMRERLRAHARMRGGVASSNVSSAAASRTATPAVPGFSRGISPILGGPGSSGVGVSHHGSPLQPIPILLSGESESTHDDTPDQHSAGQSGLATPLHPIAGDHRVVSDPVWDDPGFQHWLRIHVDATEDEVIQEMLRRNKDRVESERLGRMRELRSLRSELNELLRQEELMERALAAPPPHDAIRSHINNSSSGGTNTKVQNFTLLQAQNELRQSVDVDTTDVVRVESDTARQQRHDDSPLQSGLPPGIDMSALDSNAELTESKSNSSATQDQNQQHPRSSAHTDASAAPSRLPTAVNTPGVVILGEHNDARRKRQEFNVQKSAWEMFHSELMKEEELALIEQTTAPAAPATTGAQQQLNTSTGRVDASPAVSDMGHGNLGTSRDTAHSSSLGSPIADGSLLGHSTSAAAEKKVNTTPATSVVGVTMNYRRFARDAEVWQWEAKLMPERPLPTQNEDSSSSEEENDANERAREQLVARPAHVEKMSSDDEETETMLRRYRELSEKISPARDHTLGPRRKSLSELLRKQEKSFRKLRANREQLLNSPDALSSNDNDDRTATTTARPDSAATNATAMTAPPEAAIKRTQKQLKDSSPSSITILRAENIEERQVIIRDALHAWVEGGYRYHTHRHEQAAFRIQAAFRMHLAREVTAHRRWLRKRNIELMMEAELDVMAEWTVSQSASEADAKDKAAFDRTVRLVQGFVKRVQANNIRRTKARKRFVEAQQEVERYAAAVIHGAVAGYVSRRELFFRANPQIAELLLTKERNSSATKIQRIVRGRQARSKIALWKQTVVHIQRAFRQFSARSALAIRRKRRLAEDSGAVGSHAARIIQRFLRELVRQKYRRLRAQLPQFLLLQRVGRGFKQGRKAASALLWRKRHLAAARIQSLGRRLFAKARVSELLKAQANDAHEDTRQHAAIVITRTMRQNAHIRIAQRGARRRTAAIAIQRVWRGHRARLSVERHRQEHHAAVEALRQEDAATRINAVARGFLTRRHLQRFPTARSKSEESQQAGTKEPSEERPPSRPLSAVLRDGDQEAERAAKTLARAYFVHIRQPKLVKHVHRSARVVTMFIERVPSLRKVQMRRRNRRRDIQHREQEAELMQEKYATVRIQCASRSMLANRLVSTRRRRRESEEGLVRRDEAAAVLTRFMRRVAARKRMQRRMKKDYAARAVVTSE